MTNYFKNKINMAMKANSFINHLNKDYKEDIKNAVDASLILERHMVPYFDTIKEFEDYNKALNVFIMDSTTENAVFDVNGNITILNFASFKHPGGMFLKGSSAQEESICHVSTLYPVLYEFDKEFYAYNRYYCSSHKSAMKHLYLDRLIYSPNILFFKDNDTKYGSVITCAAPNYGSYIRFTDGLQNTKDTNTRFLDKRIKFILESLYQLHTQNIVSDNYPGSNSLILGAFGCGVFQQDPYEVANIFKRYISMGYCNEFDSVVFAIPSKFKNDFEAFKSVFS